MTKFFKVLCLINAIICIVEAVLLSGFNYELSAFSSVFNTVMTAILFLTWFKGAEQ